MRAKGVRGLAAIAAVALVGACSAPQEKDDEEPLPGDLTEVEPEEERAPVELDLEAAEGLCPLIDSDALIDATGHDFKYADGFPKEGDEEFDEEYDSSSCVLKTAEGSFPDLTLANGKKELDDETYVDKVVGDKALVEGLGVAGYSAVLTEDTGAGPALLLNWINEDSWFELRYTEADGVDEGQVEDLVDAFVDLAKGIDAAHAESK